MNGEPDSGPGGPGGWLFVRRWLRVVLVAATFPMPFTNVLSGALLVMSVRHGGWHLAVMDALLAFGLLAGFLFAAGGSWELPLLAAAAFWGGSILTGHLLARYGSLTLPLQALVAWAAGCVLAAALLMPDPAAYWRPLLQEVLDEALLPAAPMPAGDWLDLVAGQMNGLLAASTVASIALALLLGQWLAGRGNAGEWGLQFASLRMGRVIGVAAVIAILLILVGAGVPGGGLLMVFGIGFALQGLAVIHWTARRRSWPRVWPLAVYLPLVLSPPVAGVELLLLALAGFVDNWISLRPGLPGPDRS